MHSVTQFELPPPAGDCGGRSKLGLPRRALLRPSIGSPVTSFMPPSSRPMARMSLPLTLLGAKATEVTAHANAGMLSSAVAALWWSTRHTLTRLSRPQVANASLVQGAHFASYIALACAFTRVARVHPEPQAPCPVPSRTAFAGGT